MKTVVSSDMVAHLWANQSQSEARNAGKTFYFRDSTIYSYGGHFPIAKHYTNKKGEKIILLTTRSYSMTTARHMTLVRRAIPVYREVLECNHPDVYTDHPDVYTDHEPNLKAMENTLTQTLEKAARARSNFGWLWSQAEDAVKRHTRYREFFGLKTKYKAISIPEDWKERAISKLKEEAEEEKKRKVERQKQEEQRKVYARENMECWINGEGLKHDGIARYDFPLTCIRLKDAETVETSRGAEIPLAHARKIWEHVTKIKAGAKESYQHNGHSLHAGAFVVNSITKDGTLRAGCHTLTYEIMKGFADRMGWKEFDPNQTSFI